MVNLIKYIRYTDMFGFVVNVITKMPGGILHYIHIRYILTDIQIAIYDWFLSPGTSYI